MYAANPPARPTVGVQRSALWCLSLLWLVCYAALLLWGHWWQAWTPVATLAAVVLVAWLVCFATEDAASVGTRAALAPPRTLLWAQLAWLAVPIGCTLWSGLVF